MKNLILIVVIQFITKYELESTLSKPKRHSNIPVNAQWLSGEGVGSWFVLNARNMFLYVIRYSPNGTIECTGLYETNNDEVIPIQRDAKIIHPSNCHLITIKNGQLHQKLKLTTKVPEAEFLYFRVLPLIRGGQILHSSK